MLIVNHVRAGSDFFNTVRGIKIINRFRTVIGLAAYLGKRFAFDNFEIRLLNRRGNLLQIVGKKSTFTLLAPAVAEFKNAVFEKVLLAVTEAVDALPAGNFDRKHQFVIVRGLNSRSGKQHKTHLQD